jgi:hypothetical protein
MPTLFSIGSLTWLAWLLTALMPGTPPQAPEPKPMAFSATLTSIKVSARPGQVVTRQFQLTLDADQPRTHFRAKVEDWWRSADGLQSHYAEPGTLRHSCAPWASLNPVESAVGPGETLNVRITVAVPRELAPGGYWCALTVDQIPDPASAAGGVGVHFVASVSTGIFLYVDPVERHASIVGIRADGDRVIVRVRNGGNAPLGIEGRLQFFAPGSTTAIAAVDLPRGTLLTEPAIEGEFAAALPSSSVLPSGRYLVRAILDIGAPQDIGAEQEVIVTRTASNVPSR